MVQNIFISIVIIISSFGCSENSANQKIDILKISIDSTEWSKITSKRKMAIDRDVLISSPTDFVDGNINYKGASIPIKIRLKGDWTDHLEGDHWSYRVKSDSSIFGMKRFNLHYPNRKGYTYQWLFFEACKKEKIISPYENFVLLNMNSDTSVYQIEEHFDFPLLIKYNLESGVIVRFDESEPWNQMILGQEWTKRNDSIYFKNAKVDEFRTKTVNADTLLNQQSSIAKSKLNLFRLGLLEAHEVFNIESMALYFALCDLFGGNHGLRWHNMRFYYNPTEERLFPIAFDNSPGQSNLAQSYELKGKNSHYLRLFLNSKSFKKSYKMAVHRITKPQYIDDLLENTKGEHDRIIRIIQKEFPKYKFSSRFLETNAQRLKSHFRNINP